MPFGTFVAGVGNAATPDTQPGCYGVTLAPSEGVSYIGFGHIPNYNLVNPYIGVDEWQEGFSQELSSPMIANGCPYIFTIDLANGLTPDPWNGTGIQTTIGEVRVYGGFDFCSEEELKLLEDNNQIAVTYCSEKGNESLEHNPNGALKNIAGIVNKNRNVLGMMPHPERMIDKYLSGEDGSLFFENLIGNLK